MYKVADRNRGTRVFLHIQYYCRSLCALPETQLKLPFCTFATNISFQTRGKTFEISITYVFLIEHILYSSQFGQIMTQSGNIVTNTIHLKAGQK